MHVIMFAKIFVKNMKYLTNCFYLTLVFKMKSTEQKKIKEIRPTKIIK